MEDIPRILKGLGSIFKAHPWHGIQLNQNFPAATEVYIEMVPTDVIKYEIDKVSGHLKIDRPQRYSSQCPALYGFVPQTLSGKRVGEYAAKATHGKVNRGDRDPLDLCILTERPIQHGDILLTAVPIGGMLLIDGAEADDKIIAVLKSDAVYGTWQDISQVPATLINRLRHYFLTYKDFPDTSHRKMELASVYGEKEAREVLELGRQDYLEEFGEAAELLKVTGGGRLPA